MLELKIWWTPAIPGPAFERKVDSVEEGHALLNVLVDYTRYLEDRMYGIFSHSADAGGLQALEDGEWFDAEMVLGDEAAWTYSDA